MCVELHPRDGAVLGSWRVLRQGEDWGEDGEDYDDDELYDDEEEEEEDLLPLIAEMETLFEGDGETFPTKGCMVRVHFKALLINKIGEPTKLFDTRDRRKAMEFKVGVNQLVRGWEECLPRMSAGQHCLIKCPPECGYGEEGLPPVIPPDSTIHYDIELIKVTPPPKYASFALVMDKQRSSASESASDDFSDDDDGDSGSGEDDSGEDFSSGEDG